MSDFLPQLGCLLAPFFFSALGLGLAEPEEAAAHRAASGCEELAKQ
ncbi:hypothetical protein ABMY26_06865 (plasmid) [Azospirillum sp. HJ39]